VGVNPEEIIMDIRAINTLAAQRKALEAPEQEWQNIYAEEVMKPLAPFFEKWYLYNPNAPRDPIEMAKQMHFYTPDLGVAQGLEALDRLEVAKSWQDCQTALAKAIEVLNPEAHDIHFESVPLSVVLMNPARFQGNQSYSGVTGNPGAMVFVFPSSYNLPRLKAATAHEFNHNVRFAFEPWTMQTTVGQYIIAEGLAEAFAVELFGEDVVGPYSTALRKEQIETLKPRYKEVLEHTGDIRGYIFGDWAAREFHYEARGVPDYAGYTVGYEIVRAFSKRTGKSVVEATYLPWREIVEEAKCL
jgi:uncharacterized protein YjaZ